MHTGHPADHQTRDMSLANMPVIRSGVPPASGGYEKGQSASETKVASWSWRSSEKQQSATGFNEEQEVKRSRTERTEWSPAMDKSRWAWSLRIAIRITTPFLPRSHSAARESKDRAAE
ncbi:MAG: hypothetical protein EHM37_04530 [Deltaproteobacteria bacterium]|nr:MAG: hypothetical protein EHM37_04530 [Deltaproteobacteria bacterium]